MNVTEETNVTADAEVTLVTMRFTTSDPARSSAALARYVVLTRSHPGCVNVDLCTSATDPSVLVVLQKWDSATSQRAHFDSDDMVRMASDLSGLLTAAPSIELLDPISAHDLR